MPAPTLLSEDSSNSEHDSDPEPYPEDMVYPEQEDTLDDGDMYADTAATAFVPAAADSQLSLADARSQDDHFADDPGSLNAIPSNTPIRSPDNANGQFWTCVIPFDVCAFNHSWLRTSSFFRYALPCG